MTIVAILLAYAAGVGTMGARMLARASWPARAPLLAILTYLAAAWSVVAAIALAGLTLAVHATALGGALSQPAKPLGGSRRLLLHAMATGLVLGPLVMALAPAVLALALGRVPHP